jgi:hypothetical protein
MITDSGRSSNLGNPGGKALAQSPQLRRNVLFLVYPHHGNRRCE